MSSLIQYCLHLADNSLILGHRNSEWTGHGPVLEQDIALSNIALDLIGQSRNFYQYAAELIGGNSTEDRLAFLRNKDEFLNCLLVEQANGDWGQTLVRQFFFSGYTLPLYEGLVKSKDTRLSAIAAKSVKEVTYHLRWSSEWMIRLGNGTVESKSRMQRAVGSLWKYTAELYTPAAYETDMNVAGIAPEMEQVEVYWKRVSTEILNRAGLTIPNGTNMEYGGKNARHTVFLDELLNEMQYMQRAYPDMEW